jgi:hypothetical protein
MRKERRGLMGNQLADVRTLNVRPQDGPVHRSIVALDLEGSTKRTNPVKGQLRRALYDVLDQALKAAGIGPDHLEQLTDRGDGVLILIRPHDEVPKTVLLGWLIPVLVGLLLEHNAAVAQPTLQLRMRAVVHAGEIHDDGKGFYGEDLDVAFRLLDAPAVKRALREAVASPLVLVISEEIFSGIVRHGYLNEGRYERRVHVQVAGRRRRGRVHIPVPGGHGRPAVSRRASTVRSVPPLAAARMNDTPRKAAKDRAGPRKKPSQRLSAPAMPPREPG